MFRPIAKLSAIAVLLFAFASLAQAQATRTFVSGVGNDADPCSRTAPCRTFAGALIKTFINGEIDALDPGGYGTVNITKSITIEGNGTHASTLASGTTGIIINIPSGNPNDPHRSVRLRNLSINGTGPSGAVGTRTGIDGVRIVQASDVIIDNTVIQDFSQDGVEVAASATVDLMMNDVFIRNCSGTGVKLSTTVGQVVAELDNVRVQNCTTGLDSANRGRVGIRDSVFTHNTTTGIKTTGVDNIINADNIMVSYALDGVIANAGGTIRLSNSFIVQNVNGINANGGSMVSFGLNSVNGNTVDGVFTGSNAKQ